jgi:hypothetical protein
MLVSLALWGMMPSSLIISSKMPWSLIPWGLILGSLMPWIFILGQRSCTKICLFGHFFLDLCSLSLEKGALGSDMSA